MFVRLFFYLKGAPGTLGIQGPIGPRGVPGRPVSMFKILSVGNYPSGRIVLARSIILDCKLANEVKRGV